MNGLLILMDRCDRETVAFWFNLRWTKYFLRETYGSNFFVIVIVLLLLLFICYIVLY